MRIPWRATALVLVTLGVACGKEALREASPAASAPSQVEPLVVVIGDPTPAPPPIEPVTPAAPDAPEPSAEAPRDALPETWTGPAIPKLAFADAIARARAARDAYQRLGPPPPAPAPGGSEDARKGWFGRAHAAVDRGSRMYAAAFHAEDASREGRIDAIAEAAELDLSLSRRLDDMGLGAMPVAWRSDPSIASTFEDVAVGPVRRWREEARALARQCVETAREIGVATDAARRCVTLPTGPRARPTKRGGDAGPRCACDPGDPLCSASLGGWCAP